MDMEPDNEKIYFNLGMLSMDDKKYEEAKVWFDKAIEVVIDLFLNLLLIVEFAVVLLISRYVYKYTRTSCLKTWKVLNKQCVGKTEILELP